ncbi:MAG: DsbA family protein [Candidatus Bipolaricaulota bacterium]|nr:DsbA family protein [Candidatus Bipolaricaulota bacterium]MDW8030563.1 DsbA family protein [Candidatus Bipolaricaulota bacterium]
MKDTWIWILIAALAGFLAAYLLLQPRREQPIDQPLPGQTAPRDLLDEPAQGAAEAPVTIIEFADFRCGFCVRHFVQTLPILYEEYIQTGKVRYIFRNFPILGVQSRWAALAAECAHEQGRFWEYHDKLFALTQQGQEFLRSRLKSVAAELGLDAARFESCLDSQKYLEEVQEDLALGQKEGITGTPAFLINGELLIGAQPITVFRQKIEEALAKTGR